ncbi:ABC transporter ATP-binding protein [Halosimplex marinum]|uniref:ABC transporter ATP-binding protein n=1 Tax=Halosimplex marinum TaxID=3396620 RepID=UPI003F565C01
MADPLLDVRDLRVRFGTADGVVRAVDGVDFDVHGGETACLVGESGSGKTVACESITRLLPDSAAIDGEIRFDGTDLTDCSASELESYRGGRIGHVFQNPQDALDPVYTVGEQVVEAIRIHRDVSKAAAREEAVALLDRVGIGEAEARFDDYPHQFSGGMKQRAVVAMALAPDPDLLIADEPTTALDVTIQRQVLELLADLQDERGMALLFVTHDLGVVAEIADRVVVMYAGKVMETAGVHELFDDPAHPYTRALLACLPGRGEGFETIGGSIPEPTDPPDGCRFHPRCPHALDDCVGGDQPAFRAVDGDRADTDSGGPGGPEGDTDAGATDHEVSCVLYGDDHVLPAELGVSDD